MGFIRFPYTDAHQLNLDWIIKKIQDLPTRLSQLINDAGFINAQQAAAAAPVQSVNGMTGDVIVGGGGGGNVLSVNGQTGIVVLDADDVGALPDTTPIPAKTSDLTNDSGFITGLVILSYGSSTWAEVLAAYTANKVVYCRASSNADPSIGSQTRLAFMVYVNNASTPTEIEFQYYRSISTHSDSDQGDQVFVYKINSSGTWSVTTRKAYTKITAGTGLSSSYSSGTLTLNADLPEIGSIATTTTWTQQTDDYTQTVTVSGATVTANSKVDLQPDTAVLTQMISDGVMALYAENSAGTVVLHAVGAAPTAALTVQCTVAEVLP